jgi:hypothetical protein
MQSNDNAWKATLIAFIIGLGVGFVATKYFGGDRQSAASKEIEIQQANVTKQLDSIAAVAKRASDSAAVWRAAAQWSGQRADKRSQELDQLKLKRALIKKQIDTMPDTALVKRYYMSLYGG